MMWDISLGWSRNAIGKSINFGTKYCSSQWCTTIASFLKIKVGRKGKIIQSFFFSDQRFFENQIFVLFQIWRSTSFKAGERFKIGLANINFMPTIFKIMQFSFDALLPNSINTLVQIRLKLILNFQYISSSMRLLYSYNESI